MNKKYCSVFLMIKVLLLFSVLILMQNGNDKTGPHLTVQARARYVSRYSPSSYRSSYVVRRTSYVYKPSYHTYVSYSYGPTHYYYYSYHYYTYSSRVHVSDPFVTLCCCLGFFAIFCLFVAIGICCPRAFEPDHDGF